ncbi:phage minor head protein [Bacillus infantis]|uniref:phage minor head protein n=1 Tax=Bacillus infantis TaxID=324767 RepID=UPI003CF3AFA7
MNKAQKETQQAFLDSEKKTIKELKQVYSQALKDCDEKIRELSSRADMNPDNLQSIIYQKQYQEAIKGQLEGVLANLQSNQYATVSEYLTKCYEDGFVGNMYDLQKQGIPLIIPIDQKQVTKAIQLDTKLNKTMYERLGEDVNKLKTGIRAEISRGIANGSTWNQVAGKISQHMENTPFNKAYNNAIRIARTEGHRIQTQAALDSMDKAKSKGADVVKQWDSTLDGKTRDTHRKLDGQIRELDEPFEVDGMEADAPGMFGDPAEDCNCRCALLQRARWALDEEELATLEARAEYFGLDKAESFEEYEKKYLGISKEDIEGADSDSVRLGSQMINDAFVTAKTIEEAEEYARNNFVKDKTWSGNGNVSYKGLSVDSANEINRALNEIYSTQDIPKLENIQPMNFRSNIWKGTDAPMAYRALGNGELYYNPKLLKTTGDVDAYIQEGKEAFNTCKDNIDRFTGSNRELIENYIVSGRSLIADDVADPLKALTQHEMGHHIQNSIMAYDKNAIDIVKSGFDEHSIKISGYATKNSGEYIAESYSAYMNGKADLIDPNLKNYFDGLVKKDDKSIASLVESDTISYVKTATSNLETIYLPKQEYAHVMSEINTHMSDAQREQAVVSKAIGDYIYTFENHGFGNYRIIGKVPIDGDKYESIEKIFNE